jgi:hypothetical protein
MFPLAPFRRGAVAQLGERLLCKQEVVGSIPSGSTILFGFAILFMFGSFVRLLWFVWSRMISMDRLCFLRRCYGLPLLRFGRGAGFLTE